MEFIALPENLNNERTKEFEQFHYFRLQLTERSWAEKKYETREFCEWFLNELKELDSLFSNLLSLEQKITNLDFLIDVSTFTAPLKGNDTLLDFLEELNAIEELEEDNAQHSKMRAKMTKKLRSYASKPENFSYLYRWAFSCPSHPLSSELLEILNTNIENFSEKTCKFFDKEMAAYCSSIKEDLEDDLDEDTLTDELKIKLAEKAGDAMSKVRNRENDVIILCEEKDAELVSKLFKKSLNDPSLFYFAVHALLEYYKYCEYFNTDDNIFISLIREKNSIKSFLTVATEEISSTFLEQEFFIGDFHNEFKEGPYVDLLSRHTLWDLDDTEEFLSDDEKKLLYGISSWAYEKIKRLDKLKFPDGEWVTFLENKLSDKPEVWGMKYDEPKYIEGPNGKEIIVKTLVLSPSLDRMVLPVLDISSWDKLTHYQMLMMAYNYCLIYDMCVTENYTTIPLDYSRCDNLVLTNSFSEESKSVLMNILEDDVVSKINFDAFLVQSTEIVLKFRSLIKNEDNVVDIGIEEISDDLSSVNIGENFKEENISALYMLTNSLLTHRESTKEKVHI